ncbi:hypothetical protein [Desulfomicrobium escambiense]|uniref:hypothetical protein n=1 Tax=Desulfomicrobium escambiense TaxID=29503 RepID=UPI0004067936|nr:hypothetical protein [Desulfomicrobium escambiense]
MPFLVLCALLSIALHAVLLLGLDLRTVGHVEDRTLLLDIVAPAVKPAQVPPEPAASAKERIEDAPKPLPKTPVHRPRPARQPEAAAKGATPRAPAAISGPEPVAQTPPPEPRLPESAAQNAVPIGQVAQRPGTTVLANESGQDALKHGAEARFMHGVATEEFVEENYVGEYTLHDSSRVWIEDDRARSGHLILHAERMGLHRKLYRFNRFIYVYGDTSDSPSPILGSVTFFSDGYHIHQFLWEHNSTTAYFPRRK